MSETTNYLRPRARILRTFGDELISSETVAVIELVKNAYDADASCVIVKFNDPLVTGEGSIEVIDNGHGMSLNTIQNTWMEPATLMRKRETRSRNKNRRVLGEKGIGRFASSRLADTLELISKTDEDPNEVYCIFDWSQFDNEEKYLDEIEILVEQRDPEEFCAKGTEGRETILQLNSCTDQNITPNHGTILRMSNLRNTWNLPEISELKNGLSKLISPFMYSSNEDFRIYLELPEKYSEMTGLIEPPEIFKKPHYILNGTVDNQGKYELDIILPNESEEEHINGQFPFKHNEQPKCGAFYIELRVWDRDPQSMRILAKNMSSTISQIRKDLDEGSGISIYRDGFRVLPYGEPHNDWLRLDMRRVQNPTMRLSNNQIVGYVLISADSNPNLKDQSNREGLMAGKPLEDLQNLIISGLNEIEKRRYRIRPRQTLVQHDRGLFSKPELASTETYVAKKYPNDKKLISLINGTSKEMETKLSRVQDVISRYSRLVTLGELIDTVIHDFNSPLGKIVNTANQGVNYMYSLTKDKCDPQQILKRFNSILDQADILQIVVRKIEPFGGRRRGRPRQIILEDIIKEAFSVLEGEITKSNIQLHLPDTKTKVTLDPAEIKIIIINLLRNSIYWLNNVDDNERIIQVSVLRKNDNELCIEFSDSGPGIDDDIKNLIFDPYFTAKPDGVGIGLTIAGEIVTDFYDGNLELLEDGTLSGANFLITLRRRI